MKTTNKFLLTLTFFTVLIFILSSCSEQYDPAAVPETEVFSPIYIAEPEVTETYNTFKIRFTEAYNIANPGFHPDDEEFRINTYRTYRVTEKELENYHKLFAVFSPIQAEEIKQTWAYEQIEEPTEYYDGRVYYLETEQVEQMAREIFGKEVKLTHENPHRPPDGTNFPNFNNGRYEWKDPNWGADLSIDMFYVPTSAEKSENYLVIYDKYINATIINNEILYYGDSEFINGIDIPDKYKDFERDGRIIYETSEEPVLRYGASYKHTFKLAEDGTYFWVSSEPVDKSESDSCIEVPSMTEIPFEGSLKEAYDSICNYRPFRRADSDTVTVYQPKSVAFDDLAPEYVLSLAYDILPKREREIVVAEDVISSENSEYITENTEYTVYTADELEESVKALFGEDVCVEHKSFYSGSNVHGLIYDGEKYLRYSTGYNGSIGLSDYSVVLYAETDGEFVYVTDKFISFEYGHNEDGCLIVSAVYSDGAQTAPVCEGDEVPKSYRFMPADGTDNKKVSNIYSGRFPGRVVFGDMMQTYKHTFKLAEDGTYYWISSEPIEN